MKTFQLKNFKSNFEGSRKRHRPRKRVKINNIEGNRERDEKQSNRNKFDEMIDFSFSRASFFLRPGSPKSLIHFPKAPNKNIN